MTGVDEQRRLTAFHEAGHVVAVELRGGQVLDVTIEPDGRNLGLTQHCSKPCDYGFIAYAGPWATARAQWPLSELDGQDQDGCTFADYVTVELIREVDGDFAVYKAHIDDDHRYLGPTDAKIVQASREALWHRELEALWPAIQARANGLLNI
ncbi:hypothetical protein BN970_05072 [Mycolicibacterium conceptionense]|uniref:Peptidase M41 domain-containing protein n=1 Tax=Mycolicibacterium conceptionense TaxID=451644 RepID=A0A0U1DUY9_9MYCO|nr:hypothetical protein [Mycolicibacterium conceptionense]ORV29068.1 hypothetical protein AWB98_06680 [Mycolicibacterium conceptionense]CQD21626.1 hypothetical protein BN970_05072 [Mycolicibacterium conceptionense]